MSKALGTESVVAETLRHRLDEGLKRISFFIVPSAVAFLALGDVIAAVLYQTGKFNRDDTNYVWTILAGSAVGLLASTQGRLYSSTYYALRDTRTPLRYAILRVAFGGVLGYFCSLHLPRLLGIAPQLGVAGLTVASGVAGWIEYVLLRRSLNRRIGTTGLPFSYVAKLWVGALSGAGLAWAVKLVVGGWHPIPLAIVVLGLYGSCYFAAGYLLGLPAARAIIGRLLRFVPGLR
jgi:putative peptidoglycan lipid II flippase